VPDPVAAGERIGPWGELQSFLMVAELAGCQALNEALPALASALDPAAFDSLKRELTAEMAQMTARLHGAYLFHKDLYLCHFFLDLTPAARPGKRLSLIDLHRLSRHPFQAVGWRNKDLGELLYSTLTLPEITDRDRLRYWMHYKRNVRMAWPRFQLFLIRLKGRFYRWHNQGRFESSLKT
jgi:heptose I phosphotransferase